MLRILAAALFALLFTLSGGANAQQAIAINSCGSPPNLLDIGSAHVLYMDSTGVLCTSSGGGGGGSATPFTPNGNYATLTATAASSASTALPTGATVAFQNTSTVDVSCVLSASAATATTNKVVIRGGATVFVAVGSNVNTACINQTGSASNVVVLAGGTGLGTNFGGGSSGGGGGAVTMASGAVASGAYSAGSFASGALASGSVASGAFASGALAVGAGTDGWDATQGAKADSAYAGSGSASVVALLKGIYGAATSGIPAGTNIIGKVGIDQTTPGTTNGVQVNAALPAGTNTIGSMKQTDGTTVVITDPCQGVAKTYTPINISASGSAKIITGTSAKKTYICQINLVTNAANNVALTEGTGTNCGTGTAGVAGGATAASGWNFSANGGISIGMGGFAAIGTATNADDVCLNPSASTQLSGQVVWVQQ